MRAFHGVTRQAAQCGNRRAGWQAIQCLFGGGGIFGGTLAAVVQTTRGVDCRQHFGHCAGIALFDDLAQTLPGGRIRVRHGVDQRQRGLAFGQIVAQVLAQVAGVGGIVGASSAIWKAKPSCMP